MESEFLKFTCEYWDHKGKCRVKTDESFKIRNEKTFPFLDMEMSWEENSVFFGVHTKENQLLKYLNKGSNHTRTTFRAIPHGVFHRTNHRNAPCVCFT